MSSKQSPINSFVEQTKDMDFERFKSFSDQIFANLNSLDVLSGMFTDPVKNDDEVTIENTNMEPKYSQKNYDLNIKNTNINLYKNNINIKKREKCLSPLKYSTKDINNNKNNILLKSNSEIKFANLMKVSK